MRFFSVLAAGLGLTKAGLLGNGNGESLVEAFKNMDDAGFSILYCMREYQSMVSDPSSLPNDRCCPFDQNRATFGQALAYSSTVHGCCGLNLYNLETQHCCPNEVVIDIGHHMETPTDAEYEAKRVTHEGKNYIEADLRWPVVMDADNYEVKISNGYNSTYEQSDQDAAQITGTGYTMHLSSTTLEYLEEFLSYDVSIRAIDCVESISEWFEFRLVAISPEGAAEFPETEGLHIARK